MSLSKLERHHGPWTEADYLALPEDNRRIELLDGALLMSPSPAGPHQRLSSRLWMALERARPDGMGVFEAVNVRLGTGRILIPDLAVVRHDGIDFTVLDAAEIALAIEIVSPGSIAVDRAIKPRLYAEAGIPHYVRIELPGPTASLGRLVGERYVVSEAEPFLRMQDPFPTEIDLVALFAADRPPG
jgi:Uma2 family endonuclease